MDTDIIPAVSIGLSLSNTQQCVDTSLLKNSMNTAKVESQMLLQSLDPNLGQLMDVNA